MIDVGQADYSARSSDSDSHHARNVFRVQGTERDMNIQRCNPKTFIIRKYNSFNDLNHFGNVK